MRLAVVAIFKNECEYILEWLAYHRSVLGLHDFIIADNVSDDGSTQLLQALEQANVIRRIFFPRTSDNYGPQIPAYNHVIETYGKDYDYFLFIDADEFLVNESGLPVEEFIKKLAANADFGGVALNWRNFGSSGNTYVQPGLVTERFYRAAVKNERVHAHVKSLVAIRAVEKMHIHHADLKAGFVFYNESGSKATFANAAYEAPLPKGQATPFSSEIHNSIFYVAHYAVKSKSEHFAKKARRGSVGGMASREKGLKYFIGHDLNHEVCRDVQKHVTTTAREVEHLKSILKERTPYYHYSRVSLDETQQHLAGWVGSDYPGTLTLCFLLDNMKEIELPLNTPRNDVFAKGLAAYELCGFKYTWKEIGRYNRSIRVWIKGSNLVLFESVAL